MIVAKVHFQDAVDEFDPFQFLGGGGGEFLTADDAGQSLDDGSDYRGVGFFSDDDDDDDDDEEVISEGSAATSDGETEEIPASMQSWAYFESFSSSSESEYEYGFLPGMRKTMVRHRAISDATQLATQYLSMLEPSNGLQAVRPGPETRDILPNIRTASGGEDEGIFMIEEDLSGHGSQLPSHDYTISSERSDELGGPPQVRHSWEECFSTDELSFSPNIDCQIDEGIPGSLVYGDFPSSLATHPALTLEQQLALPTCLSEGPNLNMPLGISHPFKRRKVSPVSTPLKPIPQQHQQHQQRPQKTSVSHPLRTYRHQQVQSGSWYQHQPPAAPQPIQSMEWTFVGNSEAAAAAPPRQTDPIEIHATIALGEVSTPRLPLERRGGRPVPPNETDPRWNIWTVGNLEIRCTASGVGVKHLKKVLFEDDNRTGYRRSKWTHERLSAEVMARRARQEATGEVVGRPHGFLAHQGWWFYIEAM